MEMRQKARICSYYRNIKLPTIEVLGIDDDYEYLDEELITLLKDGINNSLRMAYKI